MNKLSGLIFMSLVVAAGGCKDHDHGPGGHTHGVPAPTGAGAAGMGGMADGHGTHGPALALGDVKVAHLSVKASRDAGAITAGGDAAFDVWIDAAAADPQPQSVRFWIGSADGKGALKAKAGPEKGSAANHYHAHAEVPKEFTADARFHVEIEDASGKTHLASFDPKR